MTSLNGDTAKEGVLLRGVLLLNSNGLETVSTSVLTVYNVTCQTSIH